MTWSFIHEGIVFSVCIRIEVFPTGKMNNICSAVRCGVKWHHVSLLTINIIIAIVVISIATVVNALLLLLVVVLLGSLLLLSSLLVLLFIFFYYYHYY